MSDEQRGESVGWCFPGGPACKVWKAFGPSRPGWAVDAFPLAACRWWKILAVSVWGRRPVEQNNFKLGRDRSPALFNGPSCRKCDTVCMSWLLQVYVVFRSCEEQQASKYVDSEADHDYITFSILRPWLFRARRSWMVRRNYFLSYHISLVPKGVEQLDENDTAYGTASSMSWKLRIMLKLRCRRKSQLLRTVLVANKIHAIAVLHNY